MASKIEMQEAIKKINNDYALSFPITENANELKQSLKEAKAVVAGIEADKNKKPTDSSEPKAEATLVYVWLKNPAYVDASGLKRVAGGVYHIDLAEFPRVAKLPTKNCEIYQKEIPIRKIAEIAKWFGINTDKHDDAELLKMLVKTPNLY